jgi:hypothetical protein
MRNGEADQFLAGTVRDWGLRRAFVAVIICLPIGIALGAVGLGVLNRHLYARFANREQIAEELQAIVLALSILLSLVIAWRLRRTNQKGAAALYLLFAMGLIFLTGEEIAWGQRIFHLRTPESIKEINSQGEISLHNLLGYQGLFNYFQLLVGAYGVVLPLALPRMKTLKHKWKTVSLLVPPHSLIPYFLPMFLWKVFRFLSPPLHAHTYFLHTYNEIMELDLYLGFFLFTWYQLRKLHKAGTLEIPS